MRTVVHGVVLSAVVAMTALSLYHARDIDDIETAAASVPLTSTIESILPQGSEPVGVGHPVVVTFKKPIDNRSAVERAITVKSDPVREGAYQWLDAKTVQWTPDEFWPAHSTVMLSVGGMRTQFTTGAAVIGVADISDHTFTVTIDGVEERLPAPHHLPHAGEEGVLLASLGRPDYPTPVGRYSVLAKDRHVTMDSSSVGIPIDHPDGYLLDVDYGVRITHRGLYVHSAPWAVPSIGLENTSHGCVSLIPAAAEWYFNTVKVGDPVIVQE